MSNPTQFCFLRCYVKRGEYMSDVFFLRSCPFVDLGRLVGCVRHGLWIFVCIHPTPTNTTKTTMTNRTSKVYMLLGKLTYFVIGNSPLIALSSQEHWPDRMAQETLSNKASKFIR